MQHQICSVPLICLCLSFCYQLSHITCFNQVKISLEQGSETRSKDIKGVVFGTFFFRTKSKSMFFQLKLYPSVKMRTLSWNDPDLRRHVHFNESARSMCSKHQDKTKKLVFVWWLPKRLFFLPFTCFYRLLFQKRCLLFFFNHESQGQHRTENKQEIRYQMENRQPSRMYSCLLLSSSDK